MKGEVNELLSVRLEKELYQVSDLSTVEEPNSKLHHLEFPRQRSSESGTIATMIQKQQVLVKPILVGILSSDFYSTSRCERVGILSLTTPKAKINYHPSDVQALPSVLQRHTSASGDLKLVPLTRLPDTTF